MIRKIKGKYKKLLFKYRLIILNEDTLEERITLRINKFSVFTFGIVSSFLLIFGTILLVTHTPLKEYIISNKPSKRKLMRLILKIDSLNNEIKVNTNYVESLRKVLTGEVDYTKMNKDSIREYVAKDTKTYNLSASKEDSLLREEVGLEDRFNTTGAIRSKFTFSVPVDGSISSEYNIEENHYGVDLSAAKDTPVKAITSGVVIFDGWTIETGYILIIAHDNNIISVYKHNNLMYKKQGDFVRLGEIIASVGNTGEYSTGYHLHFEVWINGYPINPMDIIKFEGS